MASNALKTDAKISPERVDEALSIRDRLIIELFVSVLDEQLVVERHILKERLANLVELAEYDPELKETIHGIVAKM
ncbi:MULTISPECIES: phosphate-starvation-inducible protein PsiE [Lysinibacillus]|uniref:Phosphate-starvation-inducible protein PsiE n=1 Tax=Lysinibacillus antri TaxID=2498145 RepID=A0A432LCC1_9BACI|nr:MULTISPECIES: phosphate-starvation-inducible protein PsiE [Lysinibacillus]RUL53553.1 phosphate-starvation-inducible protein PsiE [Lysinibacillus antri]TSI06216.1 phosphate-starvation-inducible protein PsiE [Lysinibacillus sp. BW-2-10]